MAHFKARILKKYSGGGLQDSDGGMRLLLCISMINIYKKASASA